MSHTKGPWLVDDGFYGPDLTSDDYHIIVAGCGYHASPSDDGFAITGCISTANARLISAAPELLEALEDMISFQYDGDPLRQESCPACIKARSAIAKARG